ncbi:MAG: hypothetical protein BMS9Abin28_0656 [Anaerolineae bacterium]|nr:MAG: hypothetical protein BMS9Abin28_0656 [Anaerolineae bacterium]
MSKSRIAARRAKARRRRNLTYGLVGILMALGLTFFIVTRVRRSLIPLPDPTDKSRGEPSAPVIVEEYGDFQ